VPRAGLFSYKGPTEMRTQADMFLSRAEELERRAAKARDRLKEELLRLADRYRQLAQRPIYDGPALRAGGHGV
jgi:hypothetical protein